jgi:hypothetical protein
MLTQLSTLKNRLLIADTDLQYDDLLTSALSAISATFEQECNRTFARTVDATYQFDSNDLEIIPPLFPIESVSKFELKQNETGGWVEQTGVEFIIRKNCVISLESPFSTLRSSFSLSRVTYTGGYVLPGATAGPGQTPLPDDLQQAAVEQAASWFMNRDKLGLVRYWPKGGIYLEFLKTDLLPIVRSTLDRYQRICLA